MDDCTIRRVIEIGFMEACFMDTPIIVLFLCGLAGAALVGVVYNLFCIWAGG